MEALTPKGADVLGDWCRDMLRRGVLPSSIDARRIQVRAVSRDLDLFDCTLRELSLIHI